MTTGHFASLKAVLFLDLVESSRLMSAQEQEVVEFLQRAFAEFENHCASHGGQLIKTTGDGAMVIFDTASNAISYSLAIHRVVRTLPHGLDEQPGFRAGIHVGEVTHRKNDVYGHTVNVAARLESIAGLGETCVSAEVFALTQNHTSFTFKAIGGQRLKSIPDQMSVFVVNGETNGATPAAQPKINIQTYGGFAIDQPAKKLAPTWRDIRCLPIAYLALNGTSSESIGRLCALFWPERDLQQARRSLNRLIRQINNTFGEVCFRDGVSIGLHRDGAELDLEKLEDRLRIGQIDQSLVHTSDWSERILIGTETVSALYLTWLKVTRSDWQGRIAQAIELCLDRFQIGDDGLRDAATALLHIEPGHERAARRLIRHFHANGNPGAAVKVYEDLERTLSERYGMIPNPETLSALRQQANATEETSLRRDKTVPLRIQVMAFKPADAEMPDRLESFRTEIMASLSHFRGWVVAEGAQPRGGETTHSDYRLVGNERSDESETRVTLTLTELSSGRVVWSDTLAFGTGQFLAAERGAVSRIAAALEVYLATDRLKQVRPDPEHTVIDDWLRAERLSLNHWTPEAHDEAAEIFEDLITRAPDYSSAYAGLAGLHNLSHIIRPGMVRDARTSTRAYDLAQRAAKLDPLDARNQMVVGWSAALEGDFDKASMHFELATKLNPNSPRTLISCAMGFAFFGENDQALQILQHSLDCTPVLLGYQWCYAASVYFFSGDLDAALQATRRGRDSIIDNSGWQAAILAAMGRQGEAEMAFDRLVSDVADLWVGDGPATRQAVYSWFTSAYPLRRIEERNKLAFLG